MSSLGIVTVAEISPVNGNRNGVNPYAGTVRTTKGSGVMTDKTMNDNQDDKKPMDIVAEQKLEKWLKDVGLSDKEGFVSGNRKEGENTEEKRK